MHLFRSFAAIAIVVGSVAMLGSRPYVATDATVVWIDQHYDEIQAHNSDFGLAVLATHRSSTPAEYQAACRDLNVQAREARVMWADAPAGELASLWQQMLDHYVAGASRCGQGDNVGAFAEFDLAEGYRSRFREAYGALE